LSQLKKQEFLIRNGAKPGNGDKADPGSLSCFAHAKVTFGSRLA
jgi:hypothetical protein